MISNDRAEALFQELKSKLANTPAGSARISSAMDFLKKQFPTFYWVGVYLLRNGQLEVGPYSGPRTDHVVIPIGRGVCGTAVAEGRNQIVEDVRARQNYLACNLETRSEIVVLVRRPDSNAILGQIDIDATEVSAFDASDEAFLERIAFLLASDFQHSLAGTPMKTTEKASE